MISRILEISGTGITVVVTVLLILAGRFFLQKTAKDKRTLPYQRQLFTLISAVLGLFISIALLPIPSEVTSQILSALGILFSAVIALSSTTLVGNAMAGIMLRVMKGFRAGDFIRFQDKVGRVTDLGLFHTEVQLISRDIVAVPNTLLAKEAVQVTRRAGTFVNASVSLGYDIHHTKIEKVLKEAATDCGLKEPFVFVEELLDHAVLYRVYGLLEDSSELLSKTSVLRKSMLAKLHEADIEIVSPAFTNRIEYQKSDSFIPSADPKASRQKTDSKDADIEEIAFDRAEEAESIEKLYARQEKLNHELEKLNNQEKQEDIQISSKKKEKRKN
ncbi:MAG: mechanosensitive ion channel family protein [Spirochaetia bacterium]